MEPLLIMDQLITHKVRFLSNVCFISAVYVDYHYTKRRELWYSLEHLYPSITEPCIWGSSFNVIRYQEERAGGPDLGAWPRGSSMNALKLVACLMSPPRDPSPLGATVDRGTNRFGRFWIRSLVRGDSCSWLAECHSSP